MSIPKILITGSLGLFALIGIMALMKKPDNSQVVAPAVVTETAVIAMPTPVSESKPQIVTVPVTAQAPIASAHEDFPEIDRVFQLFSTGSSKLPIVETITYTSTVPWLKGRPAWIADYASHYHTSRHFIARSLNKKPDYFTQKVFEGSQFNVFRLDKNIQFYLLCDLARLKMGFYYVDLDTNERVLLKTYRVSLGKLDATKPSGSLTPLGRYALGDRIAVYKPGMMGNVGDKSCEMVGLFGTRWIPFSQEKGFGIYGIPWGIDGRAGELTEQRQLVGQYNTDGGIRMLSEDMEELFSIVVSKPTFIEIVKDFKDAKLPGREVAAPIRN